MSDDTKRPQIHRHVPDGQVCCDPDWEEAYRRFETPEEEIAKFLRRLRRFGIDRLPQSTRFAEIFCGRGGGLVALERLGFRDLVGVDLSASLLEQYRGPAELHLADCRQLPFDDRSFDAVIVQGGVHHLPQLPEDLDAVLRESSRVLREEGTFYLVEPWRTPFLTFVHAVTDRPLVRRVYAKGDALATMTEHERETYEQWLSRPQQILERLEGHFLPQVKRIGWGKIHFAGRPRREG